MRRTVAAFASIALVAGTIALAIPAQAATYSFSPDCSVTAPPVSQAAITGDSLAFTGMAGKGCERLKVSRDVAASTTAVTVNISGGTLTSSTTISDFEWAVTGGEFTSVTVLLSFSGLNQGPIIFQDGAAPPTGDFTVNLSSSGGGSNSGSSSGSGSAPAPVMQQFGLPASGNCEDGYSDSMNWSGVGNGGWGISWAQWVNGGTGGAVCTRTLAYNTATAQWTVN